MKKKFLPILFIIVCLPVLVFAKDKPFYKKFETKNFYSAIQLIDTNYVTKEIEMNNSYIIVNQYLNYDSNNYAIILKKYDNKGNLIKESQLDDYYIIDATGDNNYFYILCETYESTELKKFDSNLNIVKTYSLTSEQEDLIFENFNVYFETNIELMNLKNDKLNIFLDEQILQFNSDFSSSKIISTTPNVIKNLFPKIYQANKFYTNIYDSNDSYQVFYEIGTCAEAIYDDDVDPCAPTINVYDNNDNFLWKVSVPSFKDNYTYVEVYDIKIIEDYIVVLENYYDRYYEEEYSDFIIYDLKGNEIERIEKSNPYYNIKATSLGFMTSYTKKDYCPVKREISEGEQSTLFRQEFTTFFSGRDYCTYKIHEEFYYLYYLVDSKVTGNGKIEVSNKAKAGEQVSFKVQADQNYTVKNVTVKDMSGNTIKVENGSFTMPEEDVIIEAEFITLNNPYTKGGLIALVGIIIISIGSYFLIKQQKLNN